MKIVYKHVPEAAVEGSTNKRLQSTVFNVKMTICIPPQYYN